MRPNAIKKELSANDSGETGTHQAGILVPKDPALLSFFPPLDKSVKNPRHSLVFRDDAGGRWTFEFIYNNNRFFGGTRNEYRLTCMTNYLRSNNLKAGDEVLLSRDEEGRFSVSFERKKQAVLENGKLRLGSTWRIVDL